MKILKIVEKVLFLVAVALGVFALVMAPIIDKKVTSSIITPMAAYFLFGIGFSIVLFVVGALLKLSENKTASLVGTALVFSMECILFSLAVSLIIEADKNSANNATTNIGGSVIAALISAIIYFVSLGTKLIIFVSEKVKPQVTNDPDSDPTIQAVLKWKSLQERGIISEEEYESKRVELLKLKK